MLTTLTPNRVTPFTRPAHTRLACGIQVPAAAAVAPDATFGTRITGHEGTRITAHEGTRITAGTRITGCGVTREQVALAA